LCEPIEGTDRSRLAECLGLDPLRYRSTSAGDAEERYFGTLDSQIPESQRYLDIDPFRIRCRHCKQETEFAQIGDREVCLSSCSWYRYSIRQLSTFQKSLVLTSGPTCLACKQPLGLASVQVQLETQIREHIAKYYLGWTICDDPTCGNRTRMMSVYGKRCLKPGCLGRVTFEVSRVALHSRTSCLFHRLQYSDAQLHNQLRFYSYLFDGAKAMKNALGSLHHGLSSFSKLHYSRLIYSESSKTK
jgi:DNA polymerase alpha subunit A